MADRYTTRAIQQSFMQPFLYIKGRSVQIYVDGGSLVSAESFAGQHSLLHELAVSRKCNFGCVHL